MRKRKLLSFIAFIISIAYLYSHINVEELMLDIRMATLRYLLLAAILSISALLLSTLRWYLFLNEIQKTSFKTTLVASISGYYLITILPPTIGHMAKVKLVGGDYFKALSALAVGLSLEILVILLSAFMLIGPTASGILGLAVILTALIYERGIYITLDSLLKFLERAGIKSIVASLRSYWKRIYAAWSMTKKNRWVLVVSFVISVAVLFLQVFAITVVGKAFGLNIPPKRALYGFVMSLLFSSVSGIPAGFGANEFGLVLGIGASTKATVTAFVYKFLFQYAYSVVGAVVFYRRLGSREDSTR